MHILKRRFLVATLAVFFVAPFGIADDEKPATYKLPKDKTEAVIILDYQGGFTPVPQNNEPELTIRADGTVILGAPFGQRKRIETKISLEELQELLAFALQKNKLADFDEAQIKQLIKAKGPGFMIADASTPVIKIHADGKNVEAKYYALGMMVRQHSEIKMLGQLEAVRKRLEALRSEIYAGGKDKVAAYLKQVNAQLKKNHPKVAALKKEDLSMAWQMANGDVTVNFQRTDKIADDTTQYISASVKEAKGQAPQTNVNVRLVSRD